MRFLNLLVAATAVSAIGLAPRAETVNLAEEIDAFNPDDAIAELGLKGLEALQEFEEKSINSKTKRGSCSLFDVSIRRDWYESKPLRRTQ